MRDLVISLFGPYTPVMVDGHIIGGLASLDYVWLASVLIFCICLCTTFAIVVKAIGSIFK